MNTYRLALVVILFSLWTGLQAQKMEAVVFEDQFEGKITINESTEWLIFSSSMNGSNLVRDVFEDLDMECIVLEKHKMIYVADIHKMPGLISKFVALPKMRTYKISVGLDKEGKLTRDWPKEEDAVTIIRLNKLIAEETIHFTEMGVLKKFIIQIINETIKKRS
jgi:hypothetical protein